MEEVRDERLESILDVLKTKNVFLTGGAGTGKSYLTNQIVREFILEHKSVVTLGSTGVSAINIAGQTIHSFFLFGISSNFEELDVSDRYNRSKIKELNKILSKLDLLVIDEISMVSADMMDMIVYRLRNGGFSGRVLVVGDFFQLPPIIKSQSNSIFGQSIYAFESSAWGYLGFENIELVEVKRTTDKEFIYVLNSIRVADINDDVINYLEKLKDEPKSLTEPTILFGRNFEATKLNTQMLRQLPTKEIVCESVKSKKDSKLSDKKIQSWINSLPVEDNLVLKEGAKVFFTTNKWGSYHNGQRAVVEHIDEDNIVVSDLKSGKLIKVDRFDFELSKNVVQSDEVKSETLFSLKQFPLRLCYAVTIHKSQGMSIDELVCNVENIFAKSQFYVALSRASNPKSLKISYNRVDFINYIQRAIQIDDKVKNYYENTKFKRIK